MASEKIPAKMEVGTVEQRAAGDRRGEDRRKEDINTKSKALQSTTVILHTIYLLSLQVIVILVFCR